MNATMSTDESKSKESQRPPKNCILLQGNPCDACSVLANFELEVTVVRDLCSAQSGDKQSARRQILSKINDYHDPLSFNFPVEIIAKIFCLCLPEDPSREDMISTLGPYPNHYVIQKTYSLLGVCKKWWEIGCSIPELWSHINFFYSPDSHDAQLSLIQLQLSRSKNHPLFIYIRMNIGKFSPPTLALIKIISAHMDRWNVLRLNAPFQVISALRKYCMEQGQHPSLPALPLTLHFGSSASESLLWPEGSHITPSTFGLQSIRFTEAALNLSRLVTLRVDCIDVAEIFKLLSSSPQLMTFVCSGFLSRTEVVPAIFNITHPSLKSLLINFVPQLFDNVTFPSLESLKCYQARQQDFPVLYHFFSRSQSPLRFMELTSGFPDEDLVKLLYLIPSLRDLKFWNPGLTRNFFQSFGKTANHSDESAGPSNAALLPHLESLFFYASQISDEAMHWSKLLCEMMPKDSQRPLSKVTIEIDEDLEMTDEIEQIILGLISSGLEIVVRDRYDDTVPNVLLPLLESRRRRAIEG